MLLSQVIALLHSELQKGVKEIESRRESGVFLSVERVRVELPFSASLTEAEEGVLQESRVKGRIRRSYMNIDILPGEGEGKLVVRFAPVRQPTEEGKEAELEDVVRLPEEKEKPTLQESPERLAEKVGIPLEDAKKLVETSRLKSLGARSDTAEVLVSLGLTPERLAKMNTRSVVRSIERAAERGRVPREYTLNLGEIEAIVQKAKNEKSVR